MEESSNHTWIDACKLMDEVKDSKDIRAVETEVPFRTDVILYDLSIQTTHSNFEDEIYKSNQWLRKNIRRGNTVAQVRDSSKNIKEVFFGRKGFEKFFDLRYEYIQYNLNEIKALVSKNKNQNANEDHEVLHNIIFGDVKEFLSQGNKISVYQLVKANGENAQISWSPRLEAWIIASKNVSLLARTLDDVELYKKDRYHYARLIAAQWFQTIKRIEAENQLDALKKDMSEVTFVGEYCGNPDYQHLIKYEKIDLIFYAIVQNNSERTCIPPDQAYELFRRYGFSTVQSSCMREFKDFTTLNNHLKMLYCKVAESDIETGAEGSVLYFVLEDKNGSCRTISLCKLKTIEYRIYRKLREKLRSYLNLLEERKKSKGVASFDNIFRKFKNEVEELCESQKPPSKLSYYYRIASAAFEFSQKYPEDTKLIHERYLTFLSCLLWAVDNERVLTPHLLKNEAEVANLMKIPWSSYTKFKNDEEVQNSKSNKGTPSFRKKIFAIVPIGIPGMGKSFQIKVIEEVISSMNGRMEIVSSDVTRQKCMENLAAKQPELTLDQRFERSGKDARNSFNAQVKALLNKDFKEDFFVLFLDKNHPPNALKGAISALREASSSRVELEIVALTPQLKRRYLHTSLKNSKNVSEYPFSFDFLMSCISRVQDRKTHETLNGEGEKSLGVMINFFSMYRNTNLTDEFLLNEGFDSILRLPFVNDSQSTEDDYPSSLKTQMTKILDETVPYQGCSNQSLLTEFWKELQKLTIKNYNFPPKDEAVSAVIDFFKTAIPAPNSKSTNNHNRRMEIEHNEEEKKEVFHPKSGTTPKKDPIYLGIFAKGDPTKAVRDCLIRLLEESSEKFPKNSALQDNLVEVRSQKMRRLRFIDDYHITSLFVGNRKEKMHTSYFTSFREGVEMDIEVTAVAYVPNKIYTGICVIDQSKVKVENAFPHLTLLTGDWKPVKSNDLLENLFGRGAIFERDFVEFTESGTQMIKEFTVKIDRETVTGYLVRMPSKLVIPGVTKAFYGR